MNNPFLRYVFLFIAAFLLTGMVFFSGCTSTPPATGNRDGFDNFVTAKMAEYEVPGAVVGIVENDTVVYLKGFGVRELGKPEKVDPDTRFQIASVSKYVTAGAVGSLVDEGKLDWDTPVVTYLPGFALKDTYAGEHATLRDLLAHRTGFRAYDGDLLGRLGYSNERYAGADALPGTRHQFPGEVHLLECRVLHRRGSCGCRGQPELGGPDRCPHHPAARHDAVRCSPGNPVPR